jgi:hypothetical protein
MHCRLCRKLSHVIEDIKWETERRW